MNVCRMVQGTRTTRILLRKDRSVIHRSDMIDPKTVELGVSRQNTAWGLTRGHRVPAIQRGEVQVISEPARCSGSGLLSGNKPSKIDGKFFKLACFRANRKLRDRSAKQESNSSFATCDKPLRFGDRLHTVWPIQEKIPFAHTFPKM